MASPESETGTKAVFSEAQMRALAGMLQGMVDKAVKDRGQGEATGGEGGASGSRDANRETPGESGVGRVGNFQGWAAGPTGGVGKWRPAGMGCRGPVWGPGHSGHEAGYTGSV